MGNIYSTLWQIYSAQAYYHRRLGHVLRKEAVLLRDIVEGRMKGNACRGRKRLGLPMLSDLVSSAKYPEVKRAAEERER